jgi:hypothetical protein
MSEDCSLLQSTIRLFIAEEDHPVVYCSRGPCGCSLHTHIPKWIVREGVSLNVGVDPETES